MFNVAGDTHCIHHVYGPDYGGRNDKTAARMDKFMQAIYHGQSFMGVDYGSVHSVNRN